MKPGGDDRVRSDLRARTHTPDLFEAEIELEDGDYSHLDDNDLRDEVQGELSAIDAELLAADEQRGRKGVFSREKADWVTIRVPPHALQTLTDAGVPYDERQAFTGSFGLGAGGESGTSTAREDLPGYDCMRAYGKEACGWDCQTAYGDVKCAQSPGGVCEVAFGEITCTGAGGYPNGPQSECVTAYGRTACGWDCKTAYGEVKCAQSPHGRCEAKFGDITCTP